MTVNILGVDTELDYLYFFDPTNGNDSNDGLTAETAIKSPLGLHNLWRKTPINKKIGTCVNEGVHTIAKTDYADLGIGSTGVFVTPTQLNTTTTDRRDTFYVFAQNPAKTVLRCENDLNANVASCIKYGTTLNLIGLNIAMYGGTVDSRYSPAIIKATTGTALIALLNMYNCVITQENLNWGYGSQYKFLWAQGNYGKIGVVKNCIFRQAQPTSHAMYFTSISSNNSAPNSIDFNSCAILGYLVDNSANKDGVKYTGNKADNCIGLYANTIGATVIKQDVTLSLNADYSLQSTNTSTEVLDTIGVYAGTYAWPLAKNWLKSDSKYYTLIDDIVTEATDLVNTAGIPELLKIDKSVVDQVAAITSQAVSLVKTDSSGVELSDDISIEANVSYASTTWLRATGDIQFGETATIDDVSVIADITGTAELRVLCSVDAGTTWLTFDADSQAFVAVDDFATDIVGKGINYTDLATITKAQWETIGATATTIRFAYAIVQNDPADNALLRSITLDIAYVGVFASTQSASYAKMKGKIEVTFLEAGTYEVRIFKV